MIEKGKVYITGVGPGDYRLLTLKALDCIRKADVVVYDRLINDKILSFAGAAAELIYVGKRPDYHAVPQAEINRILATKALEGKIVTRVKGGDPFLFGRGGEEAEYLYEQGIEFEIVPGVTSAIAVPAYAGIPVTHRDYCSSLHIITGHERPGKAGNRIDYETLAKIEGTLVFLMGLENLADICTNLIKNGKKATTPVAVIENGATNRQKVVTGVLENIVERVKTAELKPPAVTVIGEVVKLRDKLSRFPQGKLAGKRVMVTRAREQASFLREKLEELGAEVIEFPSIRIAELIDHTQFDKALKNLADYDWLIFTSVNGVQAFFKRLKLQKIDIRALYSKKLCAVGAATGQELNELGLQVDYIPGQYTTIELLKGLLGRVKPGEKLLLARADIANPELASGLEAQGITVNDLVVYRTLPEVVAEGEMNRLLDGPKLDFITFTSSATVRNFMTMVGATEREKVWSAKIVCIGPVTAATAKELGLNVAAVADVYTIDGLVDSLVQLKE